MPWQQLIVFRHIQMVNMVCRQPAEVQITKTAQQKIGKMLYWLLPEFGVNNIKAQIHGALYQQCRWCNGLSIAGDPVYTDYILWWLPAGWSSIPQSSDISNWFLKHDNEFTALQWPPQPSDANPIEYPLGCSNAGDLVHFSFTTFGWSFQRFRLRPH